MTPQQALGILDQALQQVSATRQVHAQLVQALQVLGEIVQKSAPPLQEVKG